MNQIPEIRTAIQKRFADIDIFHHVNNVAQQSYFDVGKSEYFTRILECDLMDVRPMIVTVSTSTSYMGQIRREDEIEVVTRTEKIGEKSITLFQQIVCRGEVRSESRSVMVAFDFERQESVRVPDRWRQQLLGEPPVHS
ncbi:MAG: acyl-CoA thioesterase [Alistipes sp.]|nr:acyl-CoA thioesterase [Alistipes sp.]